MTPEQEAALRECAEFLKDIVNASDEEPYNQRELFEVGLRLLNNLYETGYRLGGEQFDPPF
jgi:hypothetical protein